MISREFDGINNSEVSKKQTVTDQEQERMLAKSATESSSEQTMPTPLSTQGN
jgi:hypothetical protein